jgi:hypothetical protein
MNRERTVSAEAPANCPFSVAQDYAVAYLQRAEAGLDEAEIRVPLTLLPSFLQYRVALTFGLHFDVSESGRSHDEVRIRWTSGSPFLPDFRGTIRFRIAGTGTTVRVEGSYHVPFGAAGRMFDALLGRRIARTSVTDLTHRLATALETDQRNWRARVA